MAATYDLSMVRIQPNGAPAIQQIAGPGDTGRIITGSDKLVQKYVVILMTEKGSIPYAPKRGSNFINILKMNGMYTEADFLTAFAGAQLDLSSQLKPKPTDPSDEQFKKATVKNITITSDTISLMITIFTAAGTGIQVTVPITFVLQ
jgi:hypothetical protein